MRLDVQPRGREREVPRNEDRGAARAGEERYRRGHQGVAWVYAQH